MHTFILYTHIYIQEGQPFTNLSLLVDSILRVHSIRYSAWVNETWSKIKWTGQYSKVSLALHRVVQRNCNAFLQCWFFFFFLCVKESLNSIKPNILFQDICFRSSSEAGALWYCRWRVTQPLKTPLFTSTGHGALEITAQKFVPELSKCSDIFYSKFQLAWWYIPCAIFCLCCSCFNHLWCSITKLSGKLMLHPLH